MSNGELRAVKNCFPQIRYRKDIPGTDEWYLEVFNYFVFRYTNAVTENLNRIINDIDAQENIF